MAIAALPLHGRKTAAARPRAGVLAESARYIGLGLVFAFTLILFAIARAMAPFARR